jgi:hypothetical protein
VLLHREVRGATRRLGITFLTCGIITYLINYASKSGVEESVTQVDMPAPFQVWLPELISDILSPLDIYSIILAALGFVLFIFSFVYRPRDSE